MIELPYRDRRTAGRTLGRWLRESREWTEALVLGLPRGGVPVAVEVAAALKVGVDLMMVRKLGLPGQPEFAMGAVASGGICLRNESLLRSAEISEEEFQRVRERELEELRRREQRYRHDAPYPLLRGRCVILVDDGVATGTTMRAAIRAAGHLHPKEIVVAVPVGSSEAVATMEREADEVICPAVPDPFLSVGRFYQDFEQVSDEEVCRLLDAAWQRRGNPWEEVLQHGKSLD